MPEIISVRPICLFHVAGECGLRRGFPQQLAPGPSSLPLAAAVTPGSFGIRSPQTVGQRAFTAPHTLATVCLPSDGLGHFSASLMFVTGERHQLTAALVPPCLDRSFRGMLYSYSKCCPGPNPKRVCKIGGIIPAPNIVRAHPALEPLLGLSPCPPLGLLFSMEMLKSLPRDVSMPGKLLALTCVG